jgi:hypothetical protein
MAVELRETRVCERQGEGTRRLGMCVAVASMNLTEVSGFHSELYCYEKEKSQETSTEGFGNA